MTEHIAVECLIDFPWDEMCNPRGSLVAMTVEECRVFEAEGAVRRRPDVPPSSIPPSFVRQRAPASAAPTVARSLAPPFASIYSVRFEPASGEYVCRKDGVEVGSRKTYGDALRLCERDGGNPKGWVVQH